MATTFGLIFCVLGLCAFVSQASIFSNPLSRVARFDPMHNECGAEPGDREPCGRRYDAIGVHECKSRGCCWDDTDRLPSGTIRCFLAARMLTEQCDVLHEDKDDCGYYGISEAECTNIRKCCWRPSPRVNAPDCFNPKANPIRLMDYSTESTGYGRVEVRVPYDEKLGEWGTVCDDSFGLEEAKVICKQLGYTNGRPRIEAYYGHGTGNIYLDELRCSGDEDTLDECPHNGWGNHDCSHGEDAGVECSNEQEEATPEPEIYEPVYPDYSGDYWDEYEYRSQMKPPAKRSNNFKNSFKFKSPVEKSNNFKNSFKFKSPVEKNNNFKDSFKFKSPVEKNNNFKDSFKFKNPVEKNNNFKDSFKFKNPVEKSNNVKTSFKFKHPAEKRNNFKNNFKFKEP